MTLQPITRQSTGKLPPSRSLEIGSSSTSSPSNTTVNAKVVVTNKATPEEIKEKLEQQLRLQRAAHHQKRALEMQKAGKLFCDQFENFSFIKKSILMQAEEENKESGTFSAHIKRFISLLFPVNMSTH